MIVIKRDFNPLVIPDKREARIEDYACHGQCCRDMNEAGRTSMADLLKAHGGITVIQCLAATIKDRACDYDDLEIELASQIPMPRLPRRDHVRWHSAFVQEWFLRLIKLHLTEVVN